MIKKITWFVSFLLTVIFMLSIYLVVNAYSELYVPDAGQLTSAHQVRQYLKEHEQAQKKPNQAPAIAIPTGIFIESLQFTNSDTLLLSGYVWQRYNKDILRKFETGVIFPEATGITLTKLYQRDEGSEQVIGWYFEGKFIQSFNYRKYPIDHKRVWIRLWPKSFDKNVILTPDLSAYTSTAKGDAFGLDQGIVLSGYSVFETFFNYELSSYDSNFGIKNYIGQTNFPELHFNIVLGREVLNSFLKFMMPLVVIIIIAFLTLIIETRKKRELVASGFSLSNILYICSMLLFIVILLHIQLRETIASTHAVYLEYIYFIMYFSIVYVALNAFLISKVEGKNKLSYILIYDDNLLPKAIFLPFVLFLLLLVTIKFLVLT